MKKNIGRRCTILITVVLLSTLTACTNMPSESAPEVTHKNTPVVTMPEVTASNSPVETKTPANGATHHKETESDRKSMKDMYVSILEKIYSEQIFPDGKNYGFDKIFDISENQFAVYDIDKDGKDELIIVYTTTSMAGMVQAVYGFDAANNTVSEEFLDYPNNTFYDNGIIKAEWSHNQGVAGNNFWPYTLYSYDQKSDTYVEIAMVDAWDKSFSEVNYSGNKFPEAADVDGDGMLYYIIKGKEYVLDNPVNLKEYDQWYNSYVGSSQKVNVKFMKLTEANIHSLK